MSFIGGERRYRVPSAPRRSFFYARRRERNAKKKKQKKRVALEQTKGHSHEPHNYLSLAPTFTIGLKRRTAFFDSFLMLSCRSDKDTINAVCKSFRYYHKVIEWMSFF